MEYVVLSNGVQMPIIGYGVYQIAQSECERCVADALAVGYRHIDTAQSYFNEEQVGDAVAASGIVRDQIFLTSKVWVEHYGRGTTRASVKESLRKLKTDHIDLMLLHQDFGDVYGAWADLEDLYEEGAIRAIGVSNFLPDRLVDLCSFNRIRPMVNQIETHLLYQQDEARAWMAKYGIQHEAWAPFGEGRGGLFTNPVLEAIGTKYGKSAAQVILRWDIQRGTVALPKSVRRERMEQNIDVFDFELTADDTDAIAGLDTGTSSFFSFRDPAMVEWFAQMVEERRQNHDHTKEKRAWD